MIFDCWIIKKAREFQKNIYFCFADYPKAFDCVDHNKLWKILQEMGIPDHLPASCEICMQVKKQRLELDVEKLTDSKLGKEYDKAIYWLLIWLICRVYHLKCQAGWITSWNQDCWEKYQQPQICRWYLMAESEEELKSLLKRVKEESEKAGLKLDIQKT